MNSQKTWLKLSLILIFFNFSFSACANEYILDPNHSFVEWNISHFGFSTPSGKWLANGTLSFDEKNMKNSKVSATIKVEDLVTSIQELDKHLKSKLFFDTSKFPQATFISDKVEVKDKMMKVHGMLTVRGVSQPITLDVKFNKRGNSPITDKETVGFSGTAALKRSQFGLNTLLPGLSDEVKLNIEVEASEKSP